MSLHNLLNRLKSGVTDTSDTSEELMGYQLKASTGAGCTLDTPDTPPTDCAGEIASNDASTPWPSYADPGTTPAALARLRAASQALDIEQATDTCGIRAVSTRQVSSEVSKENDGFGWQGFAKVTSETLTGEELVSVLVSVKTTAGGDHDRWAWPHSEAMNSAEIETLRARATPFTHVGLNLDDANHWAGKLAQRDRTGDDRRLCLECANLRAGRRCGNWQAAGVAFRASDSQMPADLVLQPQRCDGFANATPNATLHSSPVTTTAAPY